MFDRWKITLFAEAVNVFNRTNRRFESFGGYATAKGRAFPRFSRVFPILPSAGLALEF